jgi:hypothetical protein
VRSMSAFRCARQARFSGRLKLHGSAPIGSVQQGRRRFAQGMRPVGVHQQGRERPLRDAVHAQPFLLLAALTDVGNPARE